MTVRVLSYNIHGGRDLHGRRNLHRIYALLENHDIDIAVLQEFDTRPSRGGMQSDIHAIAGVRRPHHLAGFSLQEDGGWYGNLIISRYPLLHGVVHNLETMAHLEPRNAVDALINTPHGPLRIIGTHLSLLASARWQEVQTLLRLIGHLERRETHPMLLMGDINEWRGGTKLIKYLDQHLAALPCRRTFPAYFPVFHLDRAWGYNFTAGTVSARCLRETNVRKISDHLPVLVEIK